VKGDDYFDKALLEEDDLRPSSGFTSSVMEAVRRQASAPPPIAFPWKRALPGFLVSAVIVIAFVTVFVLRLQRGVPLPAGPEWTLQQLAAAMGVFAAGVVSVASVALGLRLSSRTSLKRERGEI
jgi:hypothetical protein